MIGYWELNPDFNPVDMAKLAEKLGEVTIEGVENIGWYITPDYWGVTIWQAENEEAIMKNVTQWRIAMPGIFKMIKTAVAMETVNVIPLVLELAKQIK